MKMEKFESGVFKQQYEYKSFSPTKVNHAWNWDNPGINTLLEDANRALGELNAFSLIIPDVDLLIKMHIQKEASSSSRIEGTITKIEEELMSKEFVDPEKHDDWQEVQNYTIAMNNAINDLESIPLSIRLIKNTHGILLQGVRGKHKAPGQFRKSQNWIGGSTLKDAVFIPPASDEVPELMNDLESFWHNKTIEVPHLIRIAISHYQFETIHPFLDGNGRIGRLLITLYLVSKGILKKPTLYLSDYLEKHKGAYYDALTIARTSNDLIHWVKFFLVSVTQTAQNGVNVFQNILVLKNDVEQKVLSLGKKSKRASALLKLIYSKPLISSKEVSEYLNCTDATANTLIKDFEKLGILFEITGYKRNKLFTFEKYLNLFSN